MKVTHRRYRNSYIGTRRYFSKTCFNLVQNKTNICLPPALNSHYAIKQEVQYYAKQLLA